MNMNGKCKTIIGTVGEEVELHQPLPGDRDIDGCAWKERYSKMDETC